MPSLVRDAFTELAINGQVSKEQFFSLVLELDPSLDSNELSNFWTIVDKDNGGNVDPEQLYECLFGEAAASLPPAPAMLLREISGSQHQGAVERSISRRTPMEAPGVQPVCVRGLTTMTRPAKEGEAAKDIDAMVRKLVVKALAHKGGWATVDETTVQVKNCSGQGGSETYKVEASGCSPPVVALHSRSSDVVDDPLSEVLTQAAGDELARIGFAPPRLAYGGDWFIEPWEGTGYPEHNGAEFPTILGKRLAELHAMPTAWFDPLREKLRDAKPALLGTCPNGSHVWWYANRLNLWFKDESPESQEKMKAWSAAFAAFEPLSAAGRRIVTTHGDPHRENMLQTEAGIKFIDLEFTGANYAVYDLCYVITCCTWDPGHAVWADDVAKHRAFLASYLQASNQPHAPEDVDMLFHDCLLARNFNHCGEWAFWKMSKSKCESLQAALNKISLLPPADRAKMLSMDEIFNFAPLREMREQSDKFAWELLAARQQQCEWISSMQKLLSKDVEAPPALTTTISHDPAAVLSIKPLHDPALALQVKPGSTRLELATFDSSDANQKWLRIGLGLQHVGTGLFLDTEIKYCHWMGDAPWESNGTELFVRPRNDDSGRQRWVMDPKLGKDPQPQDTWLIRHKLGGRAVMVNALDLAVGKGVNVNMPCITGKGCQWIIEGLSVDAEAASSLAPEPPCTEDRLWAKDDPFNLGLRQRDDGYFSIPPAMPFVIKPPLNDYFGKSLCLRPKKDAEHGMQLAIDDGDAWNDWTLVDGDRIKHIASGHFLSSEKTHYIYPKNPECPWEQDCEYATFRIRPGDSKPDEQRWFFEREAPDDLQKEGGNVLRHFKDGMVADVDCWTHNEGQRVGHNQHYADNQESFGTSWKFVCHK